MLDYQAQEDAIRQFADVLADAGLVLKGLPIMDGRLHHVPTLGAKTKSDNAGVYVGHLDGKIWSLQTISADGEKHYTAGGRKKGLHALIGEYDPARPLVFAEGFATAASVHQATRLPVAVVFDSGNLKPVAAAYRERNPV